MSVNPLVVGPVNTSSAFGGTGVVESVADLCVSLRSGDWLAAGLAGVGAALDLVATVLDPLGSLIGAGLGWLIEHLQPLKGWLNDLTGDAGAVLGYAGTWESVAASMASAGEELDRVVRADLEAMAGESITAYATYADGLADQIRATGASASAIGSALTTCSMVVQVVHDLVRDTLAQLVGSIISWAAEAIFTLGLATPVIVEQVATRVSALATSVGRSVTDVITSAKSLKNLLEALQDLLARLAKDVRAKIPGARTVDAPTVHAPDVPNPRTALPDISDIPHPRNGNDLDEWADAVSARHPDMTPDEVKAIYRYTTEAGYKEMNGFLRNPSSYPPDDAVRIQRDVDNAVAGLNRLPTEPGIVFRGTHLPDDILAGYQPGRRVSDPAFWSTTTSQHVAEAFRAGANPGLAGGNVTITIAGRGGVDVQSLSHYGHEAEILMPPGAEYTVRSRDWVSNVAADGTDLGHWSMTLEELVP